MRLSHGIHLAYCTNIHRGGDWPETFQSLKEHTLRVRDRVSPNEPYAIGLRLGDTASRQLGQADELDAFRAWLEENRCYIFTVNGFPYGDFHGARVKEDVYAPDWTTPERVEYTKRLFDILAAIAPADSGGVSVRFPVRTRNSSRAASRCQRCVATFGRWSTTSMS